MEEILNTIGPFGRYQKFVLFLAGLVTSFTATTIYSTVFSAVDPGLICSHVTNSSIQVDQCDTWNLIKETNTSEYVCRFDTKYYDVTMVNEWELICKRKFMASLTQTLYMIGSVCGLFIGWFSDRYGRQSCSLVMTIITSLVLIISEVLQLEVFGLSADSKFIIYCICQFFVGALAKALYAVVYILVLELTTSKYSTLVSNIYLYMYVFGELLVLVIAYCFRNWHVMNWFMAAYSASLVFVILFFIPESPRYLLSVRKKDKAVRLLTKIASYNGKRIDENLALDDLIIAEDEITQSKEVIDKKMDIEPLEKRNKLMVLWRPKENLIKTALFIYIWFALALIYYGVSLGITSLDDALNPYLMYFLSCVAEVIGYVLCHLNDKFGRKRMMIIYLVSCGVVCLIVAFIPSSSKTGNGSLSWTSILKIIFASAGKASASAAFNSCYIYNSLLYPTNVRTTVVLLASNIGRIGSYISPQINLLQTLVWRPLPYIIFSGNAVLAALSVVLLPDPDKVKFL